MAADPRLQARARALGDPTRHRLFRYIVDAPGAVSVAELTAYAGLNHNAVRQHLAVLIDAALVTGETEHRDRPGRPRLVYRPGPAAAGEWVAPGAYAWLAGLLSAALRHGQDPRQAGHDEGLRQAAEMTGPDTSDDPGPILSDDPSALEDLSTPEDPGISENSEISEDLITPKDLNIPKGLNTSKDPGSPDGTGDSGSPDGRGDPTRLLEQELAQRGFRPVREDRGPASDFILGHCPFAEVAAANPDTICPLHLGLAEGLAEGLGGLTVEGLAVRPARRAGCRLTVRR